MELSLNGIILKWAYLQMVLSSIGATRETRGEKNMGRWRSTLKKGNNQITVQPQKQGEDKPCLLDARH